MDVARCLPRRLGFAAAPSTCGSAGVRLADQPVLRAIDDGGNLVACASGNVTAALTRKDGTTGTLSGTTTVPLIDGTATFTDLAVGESLSGARLRFESAYGRATSGVLTIGAIAPPVVVGPDGFCSNSSGTYSANPGFEGYVWRLDGAIVSSQRAVTLTSLSPGPHTLTVAGALAGCSVTAATEISVAAAPSTSIAVPATVVAKSTGNGASVEDAGPGATYSWSVTNGEIRSGQGTRSVMFTAGAGGSLTIGVAVSRNGCSSTSTRTISSLAPECGDGQTLCVLNGRFTARIQWRNPYDGGGAGLGRAVPLSKETGYFWFFDERNVEVMLKVLDGRSVNGSFWVVFGALTDVEYTLTLTDQQTGASRQWFNAARHIGSVIDTTAFPTNIGPAPSFIGALSSTNGSRLEGSPPLRIPAAAGSPGETRPSPLETLATCEAGPEFLCLRDGRFRVSVYWRNPYSTSFQDGSGQAVLLTPDTGAFWFFAPERLDLVVKILDGRAVNGKFWFASGALTDVEYSVSVQDLTSSLVRYYVNPPRTLHSFIDLQTF